MKFEMKYQMTGVVYVVASDETEALDKFDEMTMDELRANVDDVDCMEIGDAGDDCDDKGEWE